jgi:hypothetical protein
MGYLRALLVLMKYMNPILNFLKRHPIVVVFYSLYTWLWVESLEIKLRYYEGLKHLPPGVSGITINGEGVSLWMMMFFIIAFIFLMVILINAIIFKKNNNPYYWLCLIIIAQACLVSFVK